MTAASEETRSTAVETARDYYNSKDADYFYSQIWGGEDIHIGLYEAVDEAINEASQRTVVTMAGRLSGLDADCHVLDIGSGYCGAARYLAKTYGIRVTGLNLSEVENKKAREHNISAGLSSYIEVCDGSFETMPFESASSSHNGFDIVWSQDAILHSGNRQQVFAETYRVLKSGGYFIFTDPMQADDCPEGVLQPILDRIHLSSLGSPNYYCTIAKALGFEVLDFDDQTNQLVNHYQRVLEETEARAAELEGKVSANYVERMKAGLRYWITGGKAGYLAWGIFLLRKP
ncbi:sarcosine/dimethylglycine N-methyltransferase [Nitrosomonas cryotolerans]|uniref:Sarcosine/dimethylglycine N-methyltransferase n=1 Tax=Nitrosomonas cryotolerans ATCC 49181 TaxID=1131553 RepID=A0A1N6FN44_9PROT|nr:class I SAM-dependent methyltransferase [Nitrosomonas cryotolerans]SFP78366.1 sarcosine/dimethylglycine N-methyltransferase [Nitrosomonas cryotolerans]SIN96686.1 sarcosine/dimethylglycine N-methyltransferase [Nitrosomonas cryotolerans ATCC 49181]